MSLFDLLGGAGVEPSQYDQLFGSAVKAYAKYQIGEETARRVLPDSEDTKIRRAQALLDIKLKKKQLGLPYESNDYEEALNDEKSYLVRSTPALGKLARDHLIPDPSFLQPHSAPWFNTGTTFQKTKEAAAGGILSSGLRTGGGRYGRAAGVIGRIFGG